VHCMPTCDGSHNPFVLTARQAFVSSIVGNADLMNAIALNSAMFNGARVIGPAAAGLLVARWGEAAAFFVNAASFVAVIMALLAIHNDGLPLPRQRNRLVGEIAEGIRYAVGTRRARVRPLADGQPLRRQLQRLRPAHRA